MEKYIGKLLEGRYEIRELIGMGGMANVYKAYDRLEDRTVAVKILKEEFDKNDEFIRRFKNESKAIAMLSHPNIVKVFDFTLNDRTQAIVMEYIDGIPLKQYIEQQGALKWKEAVYFTVQILRALEHAHEKGIVHRDIKPQNIMLLQDGTIKVMDFGIARFSQSETRTMTDKAIGSVHYISPEQAQGNITDGRSDIYSVGVMLFEMLTGRLPFEADSPVSVAIQQISVQPKSPRELNSSIPEGLEEIVLKAMQKDIAKRYQSAAEMLSDIEEFKKNPSIQFQYKYFEDETPTKFYDTKDITQQLDTDAAEEAAKKKSNKSMYTLAAIAAAFVLVLLGLVGFMLVEQGVFFKVDDIKLPNFTGMTVEEAKEQPGCGKIKFVVEEVETAEYEQGKIFDQDPAAERLVKENTTVTLKVSKGAEMKKVPDVTNYSKDEAEAELKKQGFKVATAEIYETEITEGYVVRTSPEKDSEVAAGSTVTLYISMGEEVKLASVPDVRGATLDGAKRTLEKYGLLVGDTKEETNDAPRGTVISQDPAYGAQITKGSKVNLVISKGPGSTSSAPVEKELKVSIPLPALLSDSVPIEAFVDGTSQASAMVVPSKDRVWKPVFKGTGKHTLTIKMSGMLYQEYTLDFDKMKSVLVKDYSTDFEPASSQPSSTDEEE